MLEKKKKKTDNSSFMALASIAGHGGLYIVRTIQHLNGKEARSWCMGLVQRYQPIFLPAYLLCHLSQALLPPCSPSISPLC